MSDGTSIVNFCHPGNMSGCSKAGQGYKVQQKCSFCHEKSSGGDHCMNEVYGEYCDNVPAQRHSIGKSVNLLDVKPIPDSDSDSWGMGGMGQGERPKFIIKERLNDEEPKSLWGNLEEVIKPYMKDIHATINEHKKGSVCDNPKCPLCYPQHLIAHDKSSDPNGHNHAQLHTLQGGKSCTGHCIDHNHSHEFHSKEDLRHFSYYDDEYHDLTKYKIPHPNRRLLADHEVLHMRARGFGHHSGVSEYVVSRANVSQSVLIERAQCGFLVPATEQNLFYDTEYHVYYGYKEGKLVCLMGHSINHLMGHFEDWTKVVPEGSVT